MSDIRAALRRLADATHDAILEGRTTFDLQDALSAARAALDARPGAAAIGWQRKDGSLHRGCPPIGEPDGWRPVYAAPPAPQTQRPVRLTDADLERIWESGDNWIELARAVEAEVLKLNGIGGDDE